MSVTRSQILGGPAYAAFNSKNIQFASDSRIVFEEVWGEVEASLYGMIDKTQRDALVKASGTPLFYDTAQIATLWPYLAAVRGTVYPGSSGFGLRVEQQQRGHGDVEQRAGRQDAGPGTGSERAGAGPDGNLGRDRQRGQCERSQQLFFCRAAKATATRQCPARRFWAGRNSRRRGEA